MLILAISDYYSANDKPTLLSFRKQYQFDVVATLGDLFPIVYRDVQEIFPDVPRLAVMGNHDSVNRAIKADQAGFYLLNLKAIQIQGVTFAGFNGSIRYKRGGNYMWTQEEATEQAKWIPPADVLLAHSNPYSLPPLYSSDTAHTGLKGLDEYIYAQSPKLMLCGHLHKNTQRKIGATKVQVVYGAKVVPCCNRKDG